MENFVCILFSNGFQLRVQENENSEKHLGLRIRSAKTF